MATVSRIVKNAATPAVIPPHIKMVINGNMVRAMVNCNRYTRI